MELISKKDVCKRLGVSRTLLWQMTKTPDFPRPVELTRGRKMFLQSEIEAWIAERIAARDRKAA